MILQNDPASYEPAAFLLRITNNDERHPRNLCGFLRRKMSTLKSGCPPSKQYLDALIESLPRPSHPIHQQWLQYALNAPKRLEPHLHFLQSCARPAPAGIIDIGSGDGGSAEPAARLGLRIVLIDKSFAALRRAQLRRVYPTPGILQGDSMMLPFRGNQFGAALVNDVLEHVIDPVVVLREIHRVLVPGAPIRVLTIHQFAINNICSDPHWGLFGLTLLPRNIGRFYLERIRRPGTVNDVFHMATRRRLRQWLHNAGFMRVEVGPGGRLPPTVIEGTAYRGLDA